MTNLVEIAIILMAGAAGLMNISNGLKKYIVPATRVQGMLYIIIGMIIWAVGIYFFQGL